MRTVPLIQALSFLRFSILFSRSTFHRKKLLFKYTSRQIVRLLHTCIALSALSGVCSAFWLTVLVCTGAGVNPAHRSTPLACAAFLSDAEVWTAASADCALSHGTLFADACLRSNCRHSVAAHPVSQCVASASALLCRLLICGVEWRTALRTTAERCDRCGCLFVVRLSVASLGCKRVLPFLC